MLKRFIWVVGLLVSCSALASYFPDRYDAAFKDAALFLPQPTDWQLLKAQCWQESRLNPVAVSPAGAFGLCQFMPATAEQMQTRYHLDSLWHPETSIMAAALYMRDQARIWRSRRTDADRYKLTLGSYNAGAGYWIQAQKLCGMPVTYDGIARCLPDVPGVKYEEPLQYVDLIWNRWWPMIQGD